MFAANPQPQGNANIGQNVNNNDPNDEAMIFPDLSSEGVTGESTTSSPSPAPLILGGGTAGPISGFGSTPALARGSSQAESFRSDPSEIIAATPLSQRAAPIAFGLASGTSSFQAPINLTAFDDTVVNSPVAIPTPESEPEPKPEPEPEPEPPVEASALPDVGSIMIGQTLTQQTGILGNDEGDGKTLTTVNGVEVASNGQTTIVGKYGTLNIQADGTYTYDAINIDIHSDLAAHWTFDDTVGSTQAHDVSNVDRFTDTGTLHNNAAIVNGGISGNALQLDGSGYVSVQSSKELYAPHNGTVEARTISLAFRPASLSSAERQILYAEQTESNPLVLSIENGVELRAIIPNTTGDGGWFIPVDLAAIDINQWHNFTLVFDGEAQTVTAWLDGEVAGKVSATGFNRIDFSPDGEISIGAGIGGTYAFKGVIDEVKLYNRALGDQEVNILHAGNNPVSESFDYTIQDSSGGTSSSTLDITLTAPTNNAPIVKNDFLSVMADQNVATNSVFRQGVLGNDRDPEGDMLTVTHIGNTEIAPSGFTTINGEYGLLLIASDGTYSYAPFNSSLSGGVETFAYTVSDGITTTTAALTVTVIRDSFVEADSTVVPESALSTSAVYIIDTEDNINYLAVLDTDTRVIHRLGEITGASGTINTIGMGPDGILYATDSTNLYGINPATQVVTSMGAHGVSSTFIGIAVAPDKTIYGASDDGHIYSIDSSTGLATDLGTMTGFERYRGGLVWHDGALYTLDYTPTVHFISSTTSGTQSDYRLVRIEPSSSDFVVTPIGALHQLNALTSINGELTGVLQISTGSYVITIDPATGLISEYAPITGIADTVEAASQGRDTSGNLLENDTGAESVTMIALPDGYSVTVGNNGATIQGTYGTLILQNDGSYVYTLDNTLEATNNLNSGETGNDRFIYTATNYSGEISQKGIFTVFINGTDEIQTTEQALFTDYTRIDSVDADSTRIPIDFTVTTQNAEDKITEIRIATGAYTTFNVPSILTESGTVTGNGTNTLLWRATPGFNAGLDSFDAVAAGFTLAQINSDSSLGQSVRISATVSEYGADGSLTNSWTTTSSIQLRLAAIDNIVLGTDDSETLTGSSEARNEIDEIIGGAGNDILTGGRGTDFFVWRADDVGGAATLAIDTITDFTAGPWGDVLDLRDLLPDSASNILDEFLSFSFADGDTTISASLSAGGPVVQNVVLTGVDLSSTYGTTDVIQLTNQLTNDGNLLV